jgi:hypothetical protein
MHTVKKGTQNASPNIKSHRKARDTFLLQINSVCFTALREGHFTFTYFHLTPRKTSLFVTASLNPLSKSVHKRKTVFKI